MRVLIFLSALLTLCTLVPPLKAADFKLVNPLATKDESVSNQEKVSKRPLIPEWKWSKFS